SRNCLDVIAFADCAAGMGVSLEAINGDHAALDWSRQFYAALTAKGGERRWKIPFPFSRLQSRKC
ncbi:MAG: hypothetical protein XD94_0419, partial [Mesotoga prima]